MDGIKSFGPGGTYGGPVGRINEVCVHRYHIVERAARCCQNANDMIKRRMGLRLCIARVQHGPVCIPSHLARQVHTPPFRLHDALLHWKTPRRPKTWRVHILPCFQRNLPIATAVSAMRLEKPHSLSYHVRIRTIVPSMTLV